MKLLHYGTFRPQADFSHQFAVVIEIGVIISLIYCNLKTVSELTLNAALIIFKEIVSLVMLRCFLKEITSINFPFLTYYSRIAPAKVTLPVKYLAKLISNAHPFLWPYRLNKYC